MLIIGLTGGIGSGKSTVADLFAEYAVPIIDADVIAREVTEPSHPAFATIIDHFGKDLLLKNGLLDRAALRNLIFADTHQRDWLENLLHPLIRNEIEQRLKTLSAPYCIIVIPLLLEVKPYPFIDRILVIDAPEHKQIERVMSRDHVSKAHIEAILNTQIDRQHRLAQAHDIITNDGSLSDLKSQVEKWHQTYLKMG
jgi:dephospho-CoA kinase